MTYESRRRALRAAGALAVVGLAPTNARAQLGLNDLKIMSAEKAWDQLRRRCEALFAAESPEIDSPTYEQIDAIQNRMIALERQIAEIPADTIKGAAVKCRLYLYLAGVYRDEDTLACYRDSEPAASACGDVLRLSGEA